MPAECTPVSCIHECTHMSMNALHCSMQCSAFINAQCTHMSIMSIVFANSHAVQHTKGNAVLYHLTPQLVRHLYTSATACSHAHATVGAPAESEEAMLASGQDVVRCFSDQEMLKYGAVGVAVAAGDAHSVVLVHQRRQVARSPCSLYIQSLALFTLYSVSCSCWLRVSCFLLSLTCPVYPPRVYMCYDYLCIYVYWYVYA